MSTSTPLEAPIEILYEDNHILIVIKPPGIPSQEDESGDPDMLTLLKEDLKIRHNKPGNVFLGLVHRLDRPVGGVMIFAKTSKAASRLSDSVRTRTFDKLYLAVVQGKPSVKSAELRHYLRKDAKRNIVTVFDKPAPEAKEAILHFVTGSTKGMNSLVSVKLHTGRPHQIRAQMAHIGTPLVGDRKYGIQGKTHSGDVSLWSSMLSIPHPITKEWLTFHSLPPAGFPWNQWSSEELLEAVNTGKTI